MTPPAYHIVTPRFETPGPEKATVHAGMPTIHWTMPNFQNEAKKIGIAGIARNLRIGISGAASRPLRFIGGGFNIQPRERDAVMMAPPTVSLVAANGSGQSPGPAGMPVFFSAR